MKQRHQQQSLLLRCTPLLHLLLFFFLFPLGLLAAPAPAPAPAPDPDPDSDKPLCKSNKYTLRLTTYHTPDGDGEDRGAQLYDPACTLIAEKGSGIGIDGGVTLYARQLPDEIAVTFHPVQVEYKGMTLTRNNTSCADCPDQSIGLGRCYFYLDSPGEGGGGGGGA